MTNRGPITSDFYSIDFTRLNTKDFWLVVLKSRVMVKAFFFQKKQKQ